MLAQEARSILTELSKDTNLPEDLSSALDALEFGHSSSDELVTRTRTLVEEFIGELCVSLVQDCMACPKTKKRREAPPLDLTNMQISQGYAHDMYISCGGIHT